MSCLRDVLCVVDQALSKGQTAEQVLARLRTLDDWVTTWPYSQLAPKPSEAIRTKQRKRGKRRKLDSESSDAGESSKPLQPVRVSLEAEKDGYGLWSGNEIHWLYAYGDLPSPLQKKLKEVKDTLAFTGVPVYFSSDHVQTISEDCITPLHPSEVWHVERDMFPHEENVTLALAGHVSLSDEEVFPCEIKVQQIRDRLLQACTAGDSCQKRAGAWFERVLRPYNVKDPTEWTLEDHPYETLQCSFCGLERTISQRLEIRQQGQFLTEHFLGSECAKRICILREMHQDMHTNKQVNEHMGRLAEVMDPDV